MRRAWVGSGAGVMGPVVMGIRKVESGLLQTELAEANEGKVNKRGSNPTPQGHPNVPGGHNFKTKHLPKQTKEVKHTVRAKGRACHRPPPGHISLQQTHQPSPMGDLG